jgi:putative nucleotidyltransferase with HDIG domain
MYWKILQRLGSVLKIDNILFINDRDGILKNYQEKIKDAKYKIHFAETAKEALKLLENEEFSVIVTDLKDENFDSIELLENMKSLPCAKDAQFIIIVDPKERALKLRAFEIAGVDYLRKPFDQDDLHIGIQFQLRNRSMTSEVKLKNKMLQDKEVHLLHLVEEKTNMIEKLNLAMVSALENANLYNDAYTGDHLKRVAEYSALIADNAGCDIEFIKRIKLYAPLHDVGKVGMPDYVLKKKENFTDDEQKIMQQHVIVGANILNNDQIDPMARHIALYHHEKWDGSGYVQGLKGEKIPLEARIVSIADVYDALSTNRVYSNARPEEEIDRYFHEKSGIDFDPKLVEIFFRVKKKILEIRSMFFLP